MQINKIIIKRSTVIIYKNRFSEPNVFINTYNQKPYNYEYPHAETKELILSKTDIKESGDRKLISIVDVLGRESKGIRNEPLFYIYDDGTVEKQIIIE